ncbi:hypothetical protein QLX08_011353 [Tetragonisca angustula]|uniref:Uncharacterized protein n=1 Tax=Tetragonisca angustula TaxID=166442 RepID=A0AAW0Z8W3_9HYME
MHRLSLLFYPSIFGGDGCDNHYDFNIPLVYYRVKWIVKIANHIAIGIGHVSMGNENEDGGQANANMYREIESGLNATVLRQRSVHESRTSNSRNKDGYRGKSRKKNKTRVAVTAGSNVAIGH